MPKHATCLWCGSLHPRLPATTNLPNFFQTAKVSVHTLQQNRFPVTETTYLALGGGIGSFTWVDYLRVCGASTDQIIVIGNELSPYARFQRLCNHSQIFGTERIRSDSGAMPDNLWGWPGYAVREIADLLRQHQWAEAGRIAWQIFTEPVLADTYAPRAERVFAGIEQEMKRIGWQRMFCLGEVCAIRQTDDGRYVVAYLPTGGGNGRFPHFYVAPYLHLSLGYPGIRLTPETQAYRRAYQELCLVAQAYEDHEHIYQQLTKQGGLLILRGRGIVASRILQRVDEIRQTTGSPIRVVHLMRSPLTEDTVYGSAMRQTHAHWQLQPFNWPKAAFGGDLRITLAQATPDERKSLFADLGGITTSNRHDWQEIVVRGQREGWYTVQFGTIQQLKPNGRHRLVAEVQNYTSPQETNRLVADFMIDCTGLDAQLGMHPILSDLGSRYKLPQNDVGRLAVTPDFELKGLRNGGGQVFMAGTMAFGNEFAPVDSFMGLQYAAQRSVDALVRENSPGLRYLSGLESLRQWGRWLTGAKPG